MPTLLLIAVFSSLAAAALPGGSLVQMRWRALFAALVSLAAAAVVIGKYPPGGEDFALVDVPWLAARGAGVDVRFSLALDGLSLWLFGLTAVLMVVAVLIGWDAVRQQFGLYYRLLMVLETGLLGVFVARDIVLFYLFFEFTLLPLFFLIGVWGSRQRRYAAIKFFLFTLAGSVLTLLGLLAIVLWDWGHAPVGAAMTFSIPELTRRLAEHPIDPSLQTWIFLALFAGFAVKTPLFPLHTWLPLAHVEAPAAGSILLAGVLLKVGSYGFVRFNLPLLPQATAALMPWLLWLSVVGILYGAMVALAQSDMKRLIAYSSVSHLGFCMLGVFALNRLAVQGGVLQMINHGLTTGGLFAVVGMLYDRYHTRKIADFGGLARQTPRLAAAMVFLAAGQHRAAGVERLRRRVPLAPGDVPTRLGRSAAGLGRPIPRHQRPGGRRRRARGVVHARTGAAGLLRAAAGADSPCRRRARPRPRSPRSLRPGAAGCPNRLDRRAAGLLPPPHGPDARPPRRRRQRHSLILSPGRRPRRVQSPSPSGRGPG